MTAPVCLLTRPEAQSRAFAALLPGLTCVISPVLAIVAVPFDRDLLKTAPGLVFTSANAVQFAGPGAGRAALCVGPQTADAARAAGFVAKAGPGDAARLIPMLAGHEDWLHVHGRHRARELPLRGVTAYDQVELPLSVEARALLQGDAPVILPLFSPRSAAILARQIGAPRASLTTVAISARADARFHAPAARRVIADAPDGRAMLRAIQGVVQGWGFSGGVSGTQHVPAG
ncbi:MAG: uroporphyrinogen-III synthase [Paracoccus sp. (in: a-proteobacteria)]|nr:uroporphyrinogen-III synthase [Paracoccus sp. (in: a-proteobacteria)]